MPTHGSLTKAGKVRNQTPKVASNKKKNIGPRRRNHRNYQKFIKNEQNPTWRRGRRRRRRQLILNIIKSNRHRRIASYLNEYLMFVFENNLED